MLFHLSRSGNSAVRRFLVATVGSLLLPGLRLLCLSDASLTGEKSKDILILIWQPDEGPMPECSRRYHISGCKFTDNKTFFSQADIVSFYHWQFRSRFNHLPEEARPPGQRWVWFNLESPGRIQSLVEYEGLFNFTMTYREDSNVAVPYSSLVPNVIRDKLPYGQYVESLGGISPSDLRRPRLVSWLVSHWSEDLSRVAFYNLLKEHIQVDVFGKVGTPLPRGREATRKMIQQYQFYLALENSHHTDYITEKLWNAVHGGAIPVVMGPSRENYERFLPAEAFVHVDDFPTVKELARYILKVKDSPVLIRHHLRWRKSFSVVSLSRYCMLCQRGLATKGQVEKVGSLRGWFYS